MSLIYNDGSSIICDNHSIMYVCACMEVYVHFCEDRGSVCLSLCLWISGGSFGSINSIEPTRQQLKILEPFHANHRYILLAYFDVAANDKTLHAVIK